MLSENNESFDLAFIIISYSSDQCLAFVIVNALSKTIDYTVYFLFLHAVSRKSFHSSKQRSCINNTVKKYCSVKTFMPR